MIACQIEWKLHTKAENIATELSLTKHGNEAEPLKLPHDIFKDDAYQPKTYHLRLEQGNFEVKELPMATPQYTLINCSGMSPIPCP
jgi:hypothetical protein